MIETNIQNASNAEKDVNAASDRALATASNDFERIKKLVGGFDHSTRSGKGFSIKSPD